MKGEFRLKVLEILEHAAYTTSEIMDIFLTDYHTSYRKLRGLPSRRRKKSRYRDFSIKKSEQKEKQKYQDLLTKLEKQGLVERIQPGRAKPWQATKAGKAEIKELRKRIEDRLPLPKAYNSKKSNELIILTFDVPEKEKRKREWLRAVLQNLGLKRLQKSVWLGKIALPKNFLDDLEELNMLGYVEIFAITKTGTIKHIG